MAVRIRLSRGGAKKRPYYRVVVADSRAPRDGSFIERVGSYNPMVAKDHPERVMLKEDRIKHWLDRGALPTDRVARFLSEAGLLAAPSRAEQTKQHLPKAKAQERLKEAEEKKKAAEEAAAAPAEEEAPAAEAGAEDAAEAPAEAAAEAPAEEAAEAPAEEPAAEEPAAEETPAEEPAAEETPAEEPAAEEAPTDEAPADEAEKAGG